MCIHVVAINTSPVIPTVLSKSHTLRKCPVTVEQLDLLQLLEPYLIVKGYPPFVNEQMLKHQFTEAANGAEIQSIEMKELEAHVFYANPKGLSWR